MLNQIPNPTCYELRITINEVQKDQLMSLLDDLGESHFVEGEIDCDMLDFDYDQLDKDYYKELVQNTPLILYSEDLPRLEHVKSQILSSAPDYGLLLPSETLSLKPIADQNWRESWKASFKPIDVNGQIIILPPWENKDEFAHKHKIIIDPGMAFGTGQHETTRLCLEMFLENPEMGRVLDVGTGSGILAIAACMLGSKEVLGCDIDEDSVNISIENAEFNKVTGATFTSTTIDKIPDTDFDFAFANIQIKPLIRIFSHILDRVRPGGKILVSGILNSERLEFSQFLNESHVNTLEIKEMGHWLGILCEKKA